MPIYELPFIAPMAIRPMLLSLDTLTDPFVCPTDVPSEAFSTRRSPRFSKRIVTFSPEAELRNAPFNESPSLTKLESIFR